MSDNSTILSLPLIQANQAQKHVTHNEAIRRLDALVQPVVQDMVLTDPPASPDEGDRHIVAAGASGEWLGQDGSIAVREGNAWAFIPPAEGWRVHVESIGEQVSFLNGAWAIPPLSSDELGINATADSTNRLAVSAPATLLTHEGSGHQVKVNKASASDTASLLFQTNWSGRAEMGTSGDDAFAVKVSADGSIWADSLRIDETTGIAAFPSGAKVPANTLISGRWHCQTTNDWVTFDDRYGITSSNFSEKVGTGAEPELMWNDVALFVKAGTELRRLSGLLRSNSPEVTGMDIRLIACHGSGGTWDSESATTEVPVLSSDAEAVTEGWTTFDFDLSGFVMPYDGQVAICIKPIGTITSTRYILGNLLLQGVTAA